MKGSFSKIWGGKKKDWRLSGGTAMLFFLSGAVAAVDEGLVLLQPGWAVLSWHLHLDVELLQRLFQLLLVPGVVRSYGVMEQDELVMQHFHLCGRRKRRR